MSLPISQPLDFVRSLPEAPPTMNTYMSEVLLVMEDMYTYVTETLLAHTSYEPVSITNSEP